MPRMATMAAGLALFGLAAAARAPEGSCLVVRDGAARQDSRLEVRVP